MNILINKKYSMIDFIRIPFRICPVYSGAKIMNYILSALTPSIQVLVTAKFIDTAINIFNGNAERSSIFLPLIFLMVIVSYNNLNWKLMSFINLKYSMRMEKVYRSAIIDKRAKLEYKHIENNDTWDLISRTCTNPDKKISFGFNSILELLEIVVRVISLLVILMSQVWWVGIVIILVAIPLFNLAIKAGSETYEASVEAEKHKRRAGYLKSILQGRDCVEERTLFQYSDFVNEQWYDQFEKARKIMFKVQLKNYIRTKGTSIITVFISLFIISTLIFPLTSGKITIGIFISLVVASLDLVQLMSWQLSEVNQNLALNKKYLNDLSAFTKLSEKEGALDLPNDSKDFIFESIEFKNVSFKYPNTDKYVLKDFTLRIEKSLHYAFVGVNGAGKTTITKILTGLYDDFEGEILINGKDIHEYSQAELKGIFNVVYQDFAKYYITLKENIALGNVLERDESAILKAISIIGLDEVVKNLANKEETWLGKVKENGVDLSGGEWQRLAIARAIYNPGKVIIFDEPTAALDPVAESNIYKMFGRISKGKTTLFITHRMGAARLADEIVVINEGKVQEKGSHEELLQKNGLYAEMFEAQRGWYE